jgi:general secretion pathway protein G
VKRSHSRQAGFTLMELLAVIVIIGVLAAVIGTKFIDHTESAKVNLAKTELGQLAQALDLFKVENGRYPSAGEGLGALIKNPGTTARWNGPYWRKKDLLDPWHNEYKYTTPGPENTPYELKSLGSDGREGGEARNADITQS